MKELEEAGITPAHIIYELVMQGKITVETAIKFHTGELTLLEIVKQIKKES